MQLRLLYRKNVTMVDSLVIITAFDLGIDELMKAHEVPLTVAEHHIHWSNVLTDHLNILTYSRFWRKHELYPAKKFCRSGCSGNFCLDQEWLH